jgi:hypothetical protein
MATHGYFFRLVLFFKVEVFPDFGDCRKMSANKSVFCDDQPGKTESYFYQQMPFLFLYS